jgi:hypothetical protein
MFDFHFDFDSRFLLDARQGLQEVVPITVAETLASVSSSAVATAATMAPLNCFHDQLTKALTPLVTLPENSSSQCPHLSRDDP